MRLQQYFGVPGAIISGVVDYYSNKKHLLQLLNTAIDVGLQGLNLIPGCQVRARYKSPQVVPVLNAMLDP